MVYPLLSSPSLMCKIIPSWVFRRFQYFRPHTSSLISIVRTALLFPLLFPSADILFTSSALSSLAFAQTSADKADSQENHRLENFLISVKGRDEWTRLMLAILNSVPAVERVLAQGVSVNIRGTKEFHGVTPLIFASGIGALATVKLLVERGARLNDTDSQGKTALIQATKKGHLDTILFLLQQGANPNAETNQKWTALMLAAHGGQIEVLKTLLKHGARADFQNKLGMSPAMYAAQSGHLEIVQHLLKRGAQIDLTSLNGSTALTWAIRAGHEKIIELLLKAGAKTNFLESEFQRSPLLVAAMYGREETVKWLLSAGVNVDAVDKQGANALLLALNNNHLKTALLLIQEDISVNTPDQNKRTPLMAAASQGSFELT